MRTEECSCVYPVCLKIDFDTEGAFCPVCNGFLIPLGEGRVEECIWKSELVKSYINNLSQHAGEGFNICLNRLKEHISELAKVLMSPTK